MRVRQEIQTSEGQRNAPVTIDIVIESKFLVFLHVTIGEDTHTVVVADSPFGYVTIGRTTVVQKSANASSFGCIDILFNRKPKLLSRSNR
jgi:hypothetical protein